MRANHTDSKVEITTATGEVVSFSPVEYELLQELDGIVRQDRPAGRGGQSADPAGDYRPVPIDHLCSSHFGRAVTRGDQTVVRKAIAALIERGYMVEREPGMIDVTDDIGEVLFSESAS